MITSVLQDDTAVGLGKIQLLHSSPRRISKSLKILKTPLLSFTVAKQGKKAACDSAPNSHLNLISVPDLGNHVEKKKKRFLPRDANGIIELLSYKNHPLPVLSLRSWSFILVSRNFVPWRCKSSF